MLAYLTQKLSSLKMGIDHLLLIAADGRENIYDSLGFHTFPIPHYNVVMSLTKPGSVLETLKDNLITPYSQLPTKRFVECVINNKFDTVVKY